MSNASVTDIDIDFADRDAALADLMHVPASTIRDGQLLKHVVGIYAQDIPQDPITGYASLDYKTAEARGYIKLDFLNLQVYRGVRDEAHLLELMQREPMWEMLEDPDIVEQLFHISGHFDVVSAMQPRSVMQLAMVLAMIRPAKRHLVGKDWSQVQQQVWITEDTDAFAFKKGHSLGYAMVIVVQMNLLVEQSLAVDQLLADVRND